MVTVDTKKIISIAEDAGKRILSIYHKPNFEIIHREDQSALTQADLASHQFICESLQALYPSIPIISEESQEQIAYDIRKHWQSFFLVDPLDGTKEFIKRNGEFTVNIALIEQGEPFLGVIHAPVLDITYYAEKKKGAYKISNNEISQLPLKREKNTDKLRIVISRSHACPKTQKYLDTFPTSITTVSIGSALKFGLIAEGMADIYPRFSPTMEWDTAAGHILINEAGKSLRSSDDNQTFLYNKVDFINTGFIVE